MVVFQKIFLEIVKTQISKENQLQIVIPKKKSIATLVI